MGMTPEDFVALALAEPIVGEAKGHPLPFGYAMRGASGNKNPPGVIALTWITGKDEGERQRIRAHAAQNLQDFLDEPRLVAHNEASTVRLP